MSKIHIAFFMIINITLAINVFVVKKNSKSLQNYPYTAAVKQSFVLDMSNV